jgi:hypothetical protein
MTAASAVTKWILPSKNTYVDPVRNGSASGFRGFVTTTAIRLSGPHRAGYLNEGARGGVPSAEAPLDAEFQGCLTPR